MLPDLSGPATTPLPLNCPYEVVVDMQTERDECIEIANPSEMPPQAEQCKLEVVQIQTGHTMCGMTPMIELSIVSMIHNIDLNACFWTH